MGGLFGQFGKVQGDNPVTNIGSLTQYTAAYYSDLNGTDLMGCIPSENQLEFSPTTSFTTAVGGDYVIPQSGPGTTGSEMNGFACIGTMLSSANQRISELYVQGASVTSFGVGLPFRPYSVAAKST